MGVMEIVGCAGRFIKRPTSQIQSSERSSRESVEDCDAGRDVAKRKVRRKVYTAKRTGHGMERTEQGRSRDRVQKYDLLGGKRERRNTEDRRASHARHETNSINIDITHS